MDRSNRYEAAFEAYLQSHRCCYVAVDESRRAFLGASRVKNLDFIVHSSSGFGFLVDVKGRRFPGGTAEKPRRVWECWSTQEDIDGLERWAAVFGEGYCGLLVFVYRLGADETMAEDDGELWTWRGQRFVLRAIPVEEYRQQMRVRSPRWSTVDLSRAAYRQLARPIHEFLHDRTPVSQDWPF
jgi:hypothetical protein